MKNEEELTRVLKQIAEDTRLFIELSLREADDSWDEWLALVSRETAVRCWEKKGCRSAACPAYENFNARCWLTAGTMCSGTVRGEFALKYKSCTLCDVYQEAVFKDSMTEIYEHIITLVHSFRSTQQKLRALATRDSLTGLYNRNFLNEILLNEVERTKRYGDAFSIVMLDIDRFKWINDNFGHLFGDKLLRDCAEILSKSVRASDIVVRYGGDEFLIILSGDGQDECLDVQSRLQENITDWNRRLSCPDYSLSLSVGCSMYEEGREIMEVLKEADDKMYRAKKAK